MPDRQLYSCLLYTSPFAEEEYAIAYKKGNDELGQKLDDALTKLKEDGTLDEIVSHWIGDDADQKSYTPDDSVERDGTLVDVYKRQVLPQAAVQNSADFAGHAAL